MITDSAIVIEEAIQVFDHGYEERGRMMLQAQADQMLVMAVLSDDAELSVESEVLNDQLENFNYSSEPRKTYTSRSTVK
jgi:hypothetical protein